jgi:hypothetical protein
MIVSVDEIQMALANMVRLNGAPIVNPRGLAEGLRQLLLAMEAKRAVTQLKDYSFSSKKEGWAGSLGKITFSGFSPEKEELPAVCLLRAICASAKLEHKEGCAVSLNWETGPVADWLAKRQLALANKAKAKT